MLDKKGKKGFHTPRKFTPFHLIIRSSTLVGNRQVFRHSDLVLLFLLTCLIILG